MPAESAAVDRSCDHRASNQCIFVKYQVWQRSFPALKFAVCMAKGRPYLPFNIRQAYSCDSFRYLYLSLELHLRHSTLEEALSSSCQNLGDPWNLYSQDSEVSSSGCGDLERDWDKTREDGQSRYSFVCHHLNAYCYPNFRRRQSDFAAQRIHPAFFLPKGGLKVNHIADIRAPVNEDWGQDYAFSD